LQRPFKAFSLRFYSQKTKTMNEQTDSTLQDQLLKILFSEGLGEGLANIAQLLMNTAMLIERENHIGADPYQRAVQRNGHANGFKPRTFQTAIGSLQLAVPQVRSSDTPFRTSLLEKGSRSDRALKSAIATLYVQGVSTRRVTKVMEELCGFEVSSGQVSNLNKQLDEEFAKWRSRPLPGIQYLILDATYYKVRIDGTVRDCATLKAIGVRRDDGKRMILGVSCALSEAEVHWREFLVSLKERGIGIPDLIVSDAHTGLKAALRAACNASPWQRCQFHLQQNAGHLVTKQQLKSVIASQIAAIFNAESRAHAQERLRIFLNTWRDKQPKLVAWAEENLPESFTVFDLPEANRRKLRTSNACETLNSQIKRRTRVVGLFPNEESLERLVTAVLVEISDAWESGKSYLKPQN
jgi:transposase-like protein